MSCSLLPFLYWLSCISYVKYTVFHKRLFSIAQNKCPRPIQQIQQLEYFNLIHIDYNQLTAPNWGTKVKSDNTLHRFSFHFTSAKYWFAWLNPVLRKVDLNTISIHSLGMNSACGFTDWIDGLVCWTWEYNYFFYSQSDPFYCLYWNGFQSWVFLIEFSVLLHSH